MKGDHAELSAQELPEVTERPDTLQEPLNTTVEGIRMIDEQSKEVTATKEHAGSEDVEQNNSQQSAEWAAILGTGSATKKKRIPKTPITSSTSARASEDTDDDIERDRKSKEMTTYAQTIR